MFKKLGVTLLVVGGILFANHNKMPAYNKSNEILDAISTHEYDSLKNDIYLKRSELVVILSDNSGDFDSFQKLPQEIQDTEYTVAIKQFGSIDELFNLLRDYSLIAPIQTAIIGMHGSKSRMSFKGIKSLTENLSIGEVQNLQGYQNLFNQNGNILLYSCSVGKGENSIGEVLSDITKTHVTAPQHSIGYGTHDSDCMGNNIIRKNGTLHLNPDKYLPIDYIGFNNDSIPWYGSILFSGRNGKTHSYPAESIQIMLESGRIDSLHISNEQTFRYFENGEEIRSPFKN